MTKYYRTWDAADAAYQSKVDEACNEKATGRKKNDPRKTAMPISKSQLESFVTFLLSLYTDKEQFFELVGYSAQDEAGAELMSALLQRDLDDNKFPLILRQWLTNIARMGIGVMKVSWEETMIEGAPAPTMGVNAITGESEQGFAVPTEQAMVPDWQGNVIVNVSPYRFFPDPRLPLTRFQDGEFVASEDEYTQTELYSMQADGKIAGVEHIETMPHKSVGSVDRRTSPGFDVGRGNPTRSGDFKSTVVITEVIVKIVPAKFIDKKTKKPLGDSERPECYLCWYANDGRIVRFEAFEYPHKQFPFCLAQYNPDEEHFINDGLLGDIAPLQDVMTWLVNSRIANVRKVIQNRLVVDPSMLEMSDLTEHRSVIRTKAGSGRIGVDQAVHQLTQSDVTQSHLTDLKMFKDMTQDLTGITDAIQGNFFSGRRSAAEAKNVMAGAAGRLKATGSMLFLQAMKSLGEQMIANLRVGMTVEQYVKIYDADADPQRYISFRGVNPNDIQGRYDFSIADATIASERNQQAAALQEFLALVVSNPMAAQIFGLDPKLIAYQVLKLRGIKNPQRFSVQAALLAQEANAGVQQPIPTSPDQGTSEAQGIPGLDFLGAGGGQAALGPG